ncbi:hypothetical protein N7481_012203 [Penicillium waksmanii]|uniref:uncharacterized protein n=1 Tax=Penicillium waksmanii TaxID=69791 RepID=UPI002548D9BF|nr:uncharacterized protein N7481_012203 [Penicillium waksmanii]KAJ5965489.1 hypothetical protein N7481_012203 [Penicillium waksmanii]
MTSKFPSSENYRAEIAQMEEDADTHNHQNDIGGSAADMSKNMTTVRQSRSRRKSHGPRSPTTSRKARASSGSASKRRNPSKSYHPHTNPKG